MLRPIAGDAVAVRREAANGGFCRNPGERDTRWTAKATKWACRPNEKKMHCRWNGAACFMLNEFCRFSFIVFFLRCSLIESAA